MGRLCGALALWVVAVCAALLTTQARAASRPTVHETDQRVARLRTAVGDVLERTGVPGVGLALVDQRGVIWTGGVGLADRGTGREVTEATMFRVGSVTKSFIALGVARAVDRGLLDLEAPLKDLLPDVEWRNDWAEAAPVTLANMLEHTAGFDDMHFNETFGDVDVEAMPLERVLAINPRSRTVRWQPGTRFAYSNIGTTVAATALERATGVPFERFVGGEILAPIGMPTARFRLDDAVGARLAQGYVGADEPVAYHAIVHRPAGSLMASPQELANLVLFWLKRGDIGREVVSPAMLARIERAASLPYSATDVDYGMGNYGDVLHGARGRGHDGGVPGFLSCYRYFPELGVGYVMLLNSTHSIRAYIEIRLLLFDALTAGRELPAPPRARVDPERLRQFEGYYAFASPRHEIVGFLERAFVGFEARVEGEQLVLHALTGGAIGLIPTGDRRFRLPAQSGTSVQFERDADGEPILLLHGMYFEAGSLTVARLRVAALMGVVWLVQTALVGCLLLLVAVVVVRRPAARRSWRLCAPLAAASASFHGFVLLIAMSDGIAWGTRNAETLALFAITLAFAAASSLAIARAVRELVSGSGPHAAPIWLRLYALLGATACFGLTVYGMVHGIVGLRTWAW